MRSFEKTVVNNKKRIDLFSLFRRENASMRFSDLPLFLLTRQNMSLWLCFKTVIDHKKLLMRKSCQLETVVNKAYIYVKYNFKKLAINFNVKKEEIKDLTRKI